MFIHLQNKKKSLSNILNKPSPTYKEDAALVVWTKCFTFTLTALPSCKTQKTLYLKTSKSHLTSSSKALLVPVFWCLRGLSNETERSSDLTPRAMTYWKTGSENKLSFSGECNEEELGPKELEGPGSGSQFISTLSLMSAPCHLTRVADSHGFPRTRELTLHSNAWGHPSDWFMGGCC